MSLHPANPLASLRDSSEARMQAKSSNRKLPPYRVILLNNVASDMMFVVRTIMELMRFCRTEATHKMWEAHHCGRSQLLLTHKERAELYVEQFATKGLNVVIEPA
jgi:ATP-dependent Clp protease adapter protein ClpS